VLAAGAHGNGRDGSVFSWRDRVLVEAASVACKGGAGGIDVCAKVAE
jgi:hypothetical protein